MTFQELQSHAQNTVQGGYILYVKGREGFIDLYIYRGEYIYQFSVTRYPFTFRVFHTWLLNNDYHLWKTLFILIMFILLITSVFYYLSSLSFLLTGIWRKLRKYSVVQVKNLISLMTYLINLLVHISKIYPFFTWIFLKIFTFVLNVNHLYSVIVTMMGDHRLVSLGLSYYFHTQHIGYPVKGLFS